MTPALFAYDGSADAKEAIRQGAALIAEREAVVYTAWRSLRQVAAAARIGVPDEIARGGVERLDAEARMAAEELAEEGSALARAGGLSAEVAAERADASIAAAIVRAAAERSAPVIVAGSRGRSEVASALLGSVAYGLLHAARRPVLVVTRDSPEAAAGPVVLCYDGSVHAGRAIQAAGRLFDGVPAVIAHHWDPVERAMVLRTAAHAVVLPELRQLVDELERGAESNARQVAEDGAALAREAGFRAEAVAVSGGEGAAASLLSLAAERDARALVVGSRGRSGLASLVLGSVSHALLHRSGRPVLVVPPGDGDG